ncbi:hypothetical protein AAVH_07296 [Aphelenchoides avenae]|nr:hypothetical protein AAVH_07296 [Aphelenchus avenae]
MGDYIKAQSRDVHEFELKNEKELRHFTRLVEYAEKKWNQGVFKILAPRELVANQVNFRDLNHHITVRYETWQPCVDQEETSCFVRVTDDGDQVTKEDFQALATRARQPDPADSGRMTISRFFPRRQRQIEKRIVSGTVTGSRFSEHADAFDLRNLRSILNLGTLHNGQLRQESGITVPEIVYGSVTRTHAARYANYQAPMNGGPERTGNSSLSWGFGVLSYFPTKQVP